MTNFPVVFIALVVGALAAAYAVGNQPETVLLMVCNKDKMTCHLLYRTNNKEQCEGGRTGLQIMAADYFKEPEAASFCVPESSFIGEKK